MFFRNRCSWRKISAISYDYKAKSHGSFHTRCDTGTFSAKMKLLILACFLGYAAASFLQEAAPAVDDAVFSFLKGASEVGSLREALGSDDPMFDDVQDDVTTELGKTLKQALDKILEDIKDRIDHGKNVAEDLLEKVKEIREKLKDMKLEITEKGKKLLEHIKEKAKDVLKELLGKLGLGKRNLDHTLDGVARMKFSDLVEKIRDKILSDENIQKIRNYIERLTSDNPVVQELKELIKKLRDVDIKELIKRLLEHRAGRSVRDIKDWFEKVKEFLKELGLKVTEHTKNFGKWINDMWAKGLDKLKEKHGTIKAIAMEFIANAKDMSAELGREALEFFRPYKEDLGKLWDQVVDAAKEAIGKF